MYILIINSSLILIGILLILIFGLCGWVIKRQWIDKAWTSEGNRFLSRVIYSEWQNADTRDAIEYVNYINEDEREEDPSGEDNKPVFTIDE